MIQQNNDSSEDKPIQTIITAILRQNKKQKKQESDYKKLHQSIKTVVSNLDDSIFQCKQYNEAKALRKYEIIIEDMSKKINFLQRKLKYQRQVRSPSKQYVEDLLDKLVKFQFKNEELEKQIKSLKQENERLSAKISVYENVNTAQVATGQNQKKQKQKVQSLDQEKKQEQVANQISGKILAIQVSSFAKLKYQMRKNNKEEKTGFQRFLKKIKDKIPFWSMRQFLQAIEKWSVQQKQFYETAMPKQRMTIYNPVPVKNHMNPGIHPIGGQYQFRTRKTISSHFQNKKGLNYHSQHKINLTDRSILR